MAIAKNCYLCYKLTIDEPCIENLSTKILNIIKIFNRNGDYL
jgi:hypothetical protein